MYTTIIVYRKIHLYVRAELSIYVIEIAMTDKCYLVDCGYNYRSEFCLSPTNPDHCDPQDGIQTLHGSRGTFTSDAKLDVPLFRHIFQVWKKVHSSYVFIEHGAHACSNNLPSY